MWAAATFEAFNHMYNLMCSSDKSEMWQGHVESCLNSVLYTQTVVVGVQCRVCGGGREGEWAQIILMWAID